MKPLAIDLCCGLGGWAEGLLAERWDVVGFDIERHVYGEYRYPAQLVIQNVLTLHGSQFRDADLIVASPPCQFFSYTAMPWSRAKALAAEVRDDPARLAAELALFRACFRIQREASAAARRHIPLIVENVRGAIPWVGRSRWNFGSFHLWGDVPALMPPTSAGPMKLGIAHGPNGETNFHGYKTPGFRFDGRGHSFQSESVDRAFKSQGMNWSDRTKRGQDFTRIAGQQAAGHKNGGDWFNSEQRSEQRRHWSTSPSRKAASALIAKIPLPLARHIGAMFLPQPIGSTA